MGIFGFMEDIGWMIGPAVGGLLWVSWSKPVTFIFAGIVALISLPFVIMGRNKMSHVAITQQKLNVEPEIRS